MQSFDFAKGELKKFDQMNKLVRNVYNQYVVGSVYVFNSPLGLKNVNPLFRKSYFKLVIDDEFNMNLHNAIYNPSDVNDAIKDKVKSFYIDDDNYIIFYGGKSNEEFHVGRKINENIVADMEEKMLYSYTEDLLNFNKDANEYQKLSTLDIIDRLNNYEVITLRCTEDKEIALIMTNKLFPNSKKMDSFVVSWFVKEDDEVFLMDIQSYYFDNSFLFKTCLKGIRC